MKSTLLRLFMALFIGLFTACKTTQYIPEPTAQKQEKREFRGAWIQTAFQGEYKDMTPAQLKKDFVRKLNELQRCGINAIVFQVRPEADTFYPSKLEPWSRFYTGQIGRAHV